MKIVLDACAAIAYLRGEPGSDIVKDYLLDDTNTCLMHVINLCEVYYEFLKAADEKTAQAAIRDIESIDVVSRDDLDKAFWLGVGQLKAHHKLSLADCFAVTLAQRMQATLLTSDHREFDPLAAKSVCQMAFFR